MRKVVASAFISLDGVAERPDTFLTNFDEEMDEFGGRVIATQDAVFLGRRTYDEWAEFWPQSDIEPFATFINSVKKFVVTSSKLGAIWTNTTVVGNEPLEFLAALKQESGGDIGIHGSITLTQSFIASGAVDELRLIVAPALQGRGRRLFPESIPRQLELISGVTSPTGSLLLDYHVTQESPGSFRPSS